jgi:hypothetical protein
LVLVAGFPGPALASGGGSPLQGNEWQAVDTIEQRIQNVAAARPDIIPRVPEFTWRTMFADAPALAVASAASELGECRIRILLDTPIDDSRIPMPTQRLRTWTANYENETMAFVQDATAAMSRMHHPAPGALLEDQVEAAFPAECDADNPYPRLPRGGTHHVGRIAAAVRQRGAFPSAERC